MTNEDGSINIKTKIDNSELDKGTTEIKKAAKEAAEAAKKAAKEAAEAEKKAAKEAAEAEKKRAASVEKVKNVFQELSPSINLSKIATLGFAGAAAMGIKKVVDVMNECADAYRTQLKAELALEAAAKNNPYLDGESVAHLKAFAGELQGMSEIGDEVSISLMAQLAAAGRTQKEIQDVMKAAIDMSAITGMSIDGAVKNLSKTYSGLAGELGESIPALRNLSAEEMKAGKAIEVVAKQYAGAANATKNTNVQLANAIGDMKENVGKGWDEALKPAKEALLDLISKVNEIITKRNEAAAIEKAAADGSATSKQYDIELKKLEDKRKSALDFFETMKKAAALGQNDFSPEVLNDMIKNAEEAIKEINRKIDNYTIQYSSKSITEADAKAKADAEALAAQLKKQKEEEEQKVDTLLKKYKETIEIKKQEIALRKELSGESIDELTESQELLNTMTSAYISLIQESKGLITGTLKREKDEKEKIAKLQERITTETKKQEDAQKDLAKATEITREALEAINNNPIDLNPQDKIKIQIDAIDELIQKIRELDDAIVEAQSGGKSKNEVIENLVDARARLNKELKDIKTQELNDTIGKNQTELENLSAHHVALLELKKQHANDSLDVITKIDNAIFETEKKLNSMRIQLAQEYANNINQIAQDISNFATKLLTSETENKLAALKAQNLSESEFAKKETEIKKEAAKEQYKIEMFKWTAALLTATMNTALAVSKALSEGGATTGPILAAIAGVTGAIQIATIIASKPKNPNFAKGGIVQGNNFSYDSVRANVKPGEMVITEEQQMELWKMATGRGRGSNTMPTIIINNMASNQVSARPTIEHDKIEILINAVVNKRLADGTYDTGMAAMEQRQAGARYI